MYINVPSAVNEFSEEYLSDLGKRKRYLLPIYLACLILGFGTRSLTALGEVFLLERRFKTSVCKFFRRKNFHTRNIHKNVIKGVILLCYKLCPKIANLWVLIIDGTSTKRGGFTKIENALQYRKKNKSSKGKSTKAHTFLMGLLLTPLGFRIPFTRYTYYTKAYCRKHKMKYKKQTELAILMIEELRSYLPDTIRPVVVADSYFDSKEIFSFCRENNVVFITRADKARCYMHGQNSRKLYKRGKYGKCKKDFKTFITKIGEEKWTAKHSRYSSYGMKKKRKHVYRVTGETLNVSGLGDTRVVFSWKKKNNTNKESFIVLLCSDTTLPLRKIIELYSLRWQIEIYFRELKSNLGLADFTGRDFKAYERFVDLCLMSYLFLEWYRFKKLKQKNSVREKNLLEAARTNGLQKMLRKEATKESIKYLKEVSVKNLLKKIA